MKKTRSASYPSYTIHYCLDLCKKIYINYGSYRAKREDISKVLGLSVGSLNQKIGSSVQYSFLDVKNKEGYLVTDLFLRLYRPKSEEDKNEAFLEAFKSPTLYENLVNVFENSIIPQYKALSNILFQDHNISNNACEKAASIFLENATELNLIDDDGMLILKGNSSLSDYENINEKEIETKSEVIKPNDDTSQQEDQFSKTEYIQNNFDNKPNDIASIITQPVIKEKEDQRGFAKTNSDGIIINVLLKERRTAQLILPNDAKASDLDTITNWINMMRQSFN
ncbi:hypothetical protein [Ascidiimonas aurantiaca]|uniref:hypothetical protein n=1 Tax=Ascidiimonas aurantiaca TaxID=1685432 RepID=UPI0030EED7FC